MKQPLLLLAGALVVIGVLVGFFAVAKTPPSTPPVSEQSLQRVSEAAKLDAEMAEAEQAKEAPEGQVASATRYRQFSPGVLETQLQEAQTPVRRVLFFYANWCPTCKAADQEFTTQTTQIPQDVVLTRVNYNDTDTDQTEKELAKQYGITYQHTFVQLDESGNAVAKWNGGGIELLLENLKAAE